jgi:FKBP-type peptidyl-prolyl cis-trans isomerase SlyD
MTGFHARGFVMLIERDRVVLIHYTLKNEAGEVLETSKGATPIAYLHGYGNLVPGLEKALVGKRSGDSLSVVVPPEDGYGARNPAFVQVVAKKSLKLDVEPEVGMQLRAHGQRGVQLLTVTQVGRDTLTLDGNHPMAGKALHFDVEVAEVRKATREELTHGHVHGVGGHQH